MNIRRRRHALFAAVTWLVAFEFAPWLHVALHDHLGHHHHDASGTIIVDEDDDDHDDHGDRGDDSKSTPTHVDAGLAHGFHNLAHHGVAVVPPPPAITHPLPVDRRAVFVAAIGAIDPISLEPRPAVARGPPSLLG